MLLLDLLSYFIYLIGVDKAILVAFYTTQALHTGPIILEISPASQPLDWSNVMEVCSSLLLTVPTVSRASKRVGRGVVTYLSGGGRRGERGAAGATHLSRGEILGGEGGHCLF